MAISRVEIVGKTWMFQIGVVTFLCSINRRRLCPVGSKILDSQYRSENPGPVFSDFHFFRCTATLVCTYFTQVTLTWEKSQILLRPFYASLPSRVVLATLPRKKRTHILWVRCWKWWRRISWWALKSLPSLDRVRIDLSPRSSSSYDQLQHERPRTDHRICSPKRSGLLRRCE